jgi:hypothetical protein
LARPVTGWHPVLRSTGKNPVTGLIGCFYLPDDPVLPVTGCTGSSGYRISSGTLISRIPVLLGTGSSGSQKYRMKKRIYMDIWHF